ncbi:MAG: hypothetical protein A2189_03085 [Paenibacillus sp. RIFOXYA1_FULL_44_5]|nr:MAG: hypothetical protein A2189_03085 [Paenibacillus sp. RIFOXYA1_FULL_44_5]
MQLLKYKGWAYVLFITPALLLFSILYMYPSLSSFVYAFTDWNGFSPSFHFTGFDNFHRLLHDKHFSMALKNTLLITVTTTIVQNFLALVLALILDRKTKTMSLLRTVYFMPVMLSPIVLTYVWSFIYSPIYGSLDIVLHALIGFPFDHPWLMSADTALWSIALVGLWNSVGFAMAIYLAGLQGIPQELYEAGEVDGVNIWEKFRHITFPLLAPALTINLMLSVIGCLQYFDIVYGLTGGGPAGSTETIMTLIIKTMTKSQDAGYASSMGLVLFLMISIISLIQFGILRRREVKL